MVFDPLGIRSDSCIETPINLPSYKIFSPEPPRGLNNRRLFPLNIRPTINS
jgi:hypothetical protein